MAGFRESYRQAYEEDSRKCLAAGMDDFLPKPVKVEALYQALVRWLPRQDEAHA